VLGKGANHQLVLAAVTDGAARRADPGTLGRIGNEPAVPNLIDQLILGDHLVAVLDQDTQNIEYLRFERDRLFPRE